MMRMMIATGSLHKSVWKLRSGSAPIVQWLTLMTLSIVMYAYALCFFLDIVFVIIIIIIIIFGED